MAQGTATFVEGSMVAQGHRYAICVSRFNAFITERLLEGALDALVRHGADAGDVRVYRCPGTWELGPLAARVVRAGKLDGLVALGCLIRGATDHYDLIASEVTKALGQLALESAIAPGPVAVTFGVLTTESVEQAVERAGTKVGNKGAEAALACVEQVNLLRAVKG
ncbi:MAG TPA: 6,7-dimethyl-8-ribityllumazine synthase [Myxococcales bacterium]|jgi:6,7-dimethyl-8-ribityllumazine synthase|nr:6,7-dimethyl-8-ribityllumazine synthase [Myxococcales bacterium]